MENKTNDSFLIIDGNSIMNRAFYGIRLLSTKDGTYTNACYGFLNIYYMMIEKFNPKYVAVTFDLSAPTFRHKKYSEYKAGRKSMPDELRPQMPLIKEILRAMNITILELEGYEADDIIGTIASLNSKNNIHTYILTGDRDSFQLISKNTNVIMPSSKMGKTEYTVYDEEKLKEVYNISPKQVIDMKALMGDKSDNIPGVPMVGEKTTLSLLELYNSLDNIYNNIDTIDISENLRIRLKENKDLAYLSYDLATINIDVPINVDYNEFLVKEVNLPELTQLFVRLSFKKFLEKYNINEDDIQNFETKESLQFYKNLSTVKFVNILDEDMIDNLFNNLDESVYFTYLNKNSNYDKFSNLLILLNNDVIYTINLKGELAKSFLDKFLNARCKKIGYNIKNLLKLGFDKGFKNSINFKDDVMISYYLLNATESNYSIDNIIFSLLKIAMPELENNKTKNAVQTNLFDMLDITNLQDNNDIQEFNELEEKYIYTYLYGIKESNILIHERLNEADLSKLYNEIEIPLIETLAYIESNGMYVDKNKLQSFLVYLDNRINDITKEIYNVAQEEFNINSTAQLGHILFEKLGLPTIKKNKTNYSTDKEVLEELEDKHLIVPLILEYRSLSKLKSTYIDGLMSNIGKDGRIHTTFMQAVTATGRLSSVEPNLQNIPVRTEIGSKIRECFTVPDLGMKIIDADYSQIELRVLAHMANDNNMINAYRNGIDIHSITASEVFNIPIDNVTKELRSKAKAVNFGIVYGISDYGLAKNIHSSRSEAKEYITKYLNHYTGISSYMKDIIKRGEEEGFVKTLFGRRRYLPELKSANYNTRSFGERVAMNMPIQGTAADIMKIAMNKLYRYFKENNLKSKIVMQVHDELIVEAYNDEVELVKNYMKSAMENAVELLVPLTVEINEGSSWIEAK